MWSVNSIVSMANLTERMSTACPKYFDSCKEESKYWTETETELLERKEDLESDACIEKLIKKEGTNMVLELNLESCAMFPGRQGTYNMNLSPFGYSTAQHPGQYSQDYGQFQVPDATLQQTGSAGSWAGMYAAGAAASRSATTGLEDPWSTAFVTSQGTTHHQNTAGTYSYRPTTLPNLPTDYVQNNQSPSSSTTLAALGVPSAVGTIGNQGTGNSSRQNRPPYDWMKKQTYPSAPSSGKTRTKDKYRVVYSDHQRLELEKEFHYSRYITIRRKAELAQTLSLSERQVKIWFQNRRAKERKMNKKKEEAMTNSKATELQVQAHAQAHAQTQPQPAHTGQAPTH